MVTGSCVRPRDDPNGRPRLRQHVSVCLLYCTPLGFTGPSRTNGNMASTPPAQPAGVSAGAAGAAPDALAAANAEVERLKTAAAGAERDRLRAAAAATAESELLASLKAENERLKAAATVAPAPRQAEVTKPAAGAHDSARTAADAKAKAEAEAEGAKADLKEGAKNLSSLLDSFVKVVGLPTARMPTARGALTRSRPHRTHPSSGLQSSAWAAWAPTGSRGALLGGAHSCHSHRLAACHRAPGPRRKCGSRRRRLRTERPCS